MQLLEIAPCWNWKICDVSFFRKILSTAMNGAWDKPVSASVAGSILH
jgi:hypothetical protein